MTPRSFKIRDRAMLMRVASSLASLMPSAEHPIAVEVFDWKSPKTRQQEKLFHAILQDAAEQVEVSGRKFTADAWKEYFARKFLGTVEIVLPDGEIVTRRRSTTEANIGEYNEMIEKTLDELAQEFGFVCEEAA